MANTETNLVSYPLCEKGSEAYQQAETSNGTTDYTSNLDSNPVTSSSIVRMVESSYAGETRRDSLRDMDVPVLIVGGGPTGLLMAYLLSQLGVKSMVVEKYPTRLKAPKAHAINPRSLEICRQFGLDTKAIRRLGSPRKNASWVNFVTNLNGTHIGVLPYERMDKEVLTDTPEMIHNIPQPDFEQFIADHLEQDSNTQIRKGASFVSCSQSHGEVVTVVQDRESNSIYTIGSEYVVACDGAKSAVREYLGIECEGEDSYEAMMTIHINADLRPILGEKVGMLHWILDPAVSGFIICYDLSGNQVLICNFDSKKHPVESWTSAHARSVVTSAIGKEIPFDVLSYRPWILSRKVAMKYQEGNVFLCGDAAHSFPPTGGLGLNCGLADVHNLAYKLAANLRGWGGKVMLESYGDERRRIALLYSQQSVKNGKKIFDFLKTLGLAGQDNIEKARMELVKRVDEPEMQTQIKEGIEEQREHFDNLELHIGYVYSDVYQPMNASNFSPKFIPGSRLPHAWIAPRQGLLERQISAIDVSYVWEFHQPDTEVRQFSTLDLIPKNGFALIVGVNGDWCQIFEQAVQLLGSENVRIQLFVTGKDFTFTEPSKGEQWAKEAGTASGTGLIVRPDQHILKRLQLGATSQDIAKSVLDHLGL